MVKTGDNDAAAYPTAGIAKADGWPACLAEPKKADGTTIVKQYYLF